MARNRPDAYISLSEAARLSGYSVESLRLLCVEGKIDSRRVGRMWVVSSSEVARFNKQTLGSTPTLSEVTSASVFSYPPKQVWALMTIGLVVFLPVIFNLVSIDPDNMNISDKLADSFADKIASKIETRIKNPSTSLGTGQDPGLIAGQHIESRIKNQESWNEVKPSNNLTSNPDSRFPSPDSTPRVLGVTNDEIISALRVTLAEGLPADILVQLKGEKGEKGEGNVYGPQGFGFGQTVVAPTISNPGTLGGTTYFGAREITSENITVTNNSTFNNLTISGSLTLVPDSITDTELAFNTGQHLTTTSSPTFADLTVTGNGIFGDASTDTVTTTGPTYLATSNATTGGPAVGIGTITPGSVNSVLFTRASLHSYRTSGNIMFIDSNSTNVGYYLNDSSQAADSRIYGISLLEGSGKLSFTTLNDAGFSTQRAVLDRSGNFQIDGTLSSDSASNNYFLGNVGIGTTGPGTKLDVLGTDGGAITRFRSSASRGLDFVGNGDVWEIDGQGGTPANNILIMNTQTGNVSIGNSTTANARLDVAGAVSGTFPRGFRAAPTLTATGTQDAAGAYFYSDLSVNAGVTVDKFGVLYIEAGSTVSGAGTKNNGASLYIGGATTGATNNYALWVDSGNAIFDGNVGIGTTGPQYKLDVNGDTIAIQNGSAGGTATLRLLSTGNSGINGVGHIIASNSGADLATKMSFQTRETGGSITTKMTISGDGTVGIGTTSPEALLHVKSSGWNSIFEDPFNAAGIRNVLAITRSRADGTDPVSGFGTTLNFNLQGQTDSSRPTAAYLQATWEVDQTNDTTARDGSLDFYTILNNDTGSPKLSIKSSGNVGIGTTGPRNRLDIENSDTTAYSATTYQGTINGLYLDIPDSGTAFSQVHFSTGNVAENSFGVRRNANSRGDFFWKTYNGTAYGERMTLTDAGNVGIGTTSTDARLSIANTTGLRNFINLWATDSNANSTIAGITFTTMSTQNRPRAAIWANSVSFDSVAAQGAELHFGTYGAADGTAITTSNSKMMIDVNGNVGIGTTNPSASKLQVEGSHAGTFSGFVGINPTITGTGGSQVAFKVNPTFQGITSDSTAHFGIALTPTLSAGVGTQAEMRGMWISNPTVTTTTLTNYRALLLDASGATNNTALYISSPTASANNYAIYSASAAQSYFAGNVGIGTTGSANSRLQISGTITASGDAGRFLHVTGGTINMAANEGGNLVSFGGTIVEAGSGTHPHVAGLYLNAPTITAGAAALTHASTLYISGAPTATAADGTYAIYVDDGNARFDGLLDVRGFGTHSFSAGGTGANTLRIRNTTDAAANQETSIHLGHNANADRTQFRLFPTGLTSSGVQQADGFLLLHEGAGGINIASSHASGTIRFYAGGTTESWRITGDLFGRQTTNKILVGTSDSSDNGTMKIAGGGDASRTRGGYIEVFGNEHADAGGIYNRLGDANGSWIVAGGTTWATIAGSDGSSTFTSSKQTDAFKLNATNSTDGSGTRVLSLVTAVAANSTVTKFVHFSAAGGATEMGTISLNNNAVAYNTTSDERLKTFLGTAAYGLDTINSIRVEDFYWNNDEGKSLQFGVSAQQLHSVYPLAVSVGDDDTQWSVDYGKLTTPLIKAVQELDGKTTGVYIGNSVGIGDVVAFEEGTADSVQRAEKSDNTVGVVSGSGRVSYTGQMQVKVSEENGAINAGDRLTVSSLIPGHAAKLTQSGNSIGIALEDSAGGSEGLDTITVFVQIGYQKINVAQSSSGQIVTADNDYDFNGFSLLNVKAIASISGNWSIGEDGTIVAKKLCLDEVCIDKTQLKALLDGLGQGSASSTQGSGEVAGENTETVESSDQTATAGETGLADSPDASASDSEAVSSEPESAPAGEPTP